MGPDSICFARWTRIRLWNADPIPVLHKKNKDSTLVFSQIKLTVDSPCTVEVNNILFLNC
jgi:hypothetical protein